MPKEARGLWISWSWSHNTSSVWCYSNPGLVSNTQQGSKWMCKTSVDAGWILFVTLKNRNSLKCLVVIVHSLPCALFFSSLITSHNSTEWGGQGEGNFIVISFPSDENKSAHSDQNKFDMQYFCTCYVLKQTFNISPFSQNIQRAIFNFLFA